MGEIYGNGKKMQFFFPPLIFLQVFLSQVGKKLDQGGKYYIVSPQGEKHRQRIFSPSTPPAKVEQLIAWPRRGKIKTQGKK